MHNPLVRYLLAAFILCSVVVWYVTSTTERNKNLYSNGKKRTVPFGADKQRIDFDRFTGAETLRGEKNPELVAEIIKILAQKGMPADVFVNKNTPDTHNIAVSLNRCFEEYQEMPDALRKLWANSPIDVWDVDKKKLDDTAAELRAYDSKRLTIRGMLDQPKTVFYYLFYKIEKRWEIQSSTEASKYIADYALLEEYAAAKALLKGDIASSLESAAYVFRLCQLAEVLKVVGVRSDTALTRLRFIEVLQRIVNDPKLTQEHLVYLRDMLGEQLEHKANEKDVWFGDRASGIALYHRIMMYQPEIAFEPAELDKLLNRNMYETFLKNYTKNRAADEVFYLQAMQAIIDVSGEPFYKRKSVLDQIDNTLHKSENTPQEPHVAAMQLEDVRRIMSVFAQDVSRLETAVLAIRLALQPEQQHIPTDPFTGKPYEVKRDGDFIEVSAHNKLRPFRVKAFRQPSFPPK